jgi:DNA-binding HxlR family transcriptional regulator
MVLRKIFLFKVRRFDEFCANLGIARASLDKTLSRLVRRGVLGRRPINADRRRMGYFPTAMGKNRMAPLSTAENWGAAWCADDRKARQGLKHGICEQPLQGPIVCSACHEPIKAGEVSFAPVPGRHPGPASARPQEYGKNRYVPLALLERMGPCPIARNMAAIGDPWSFLILRECFYGVLRFDDFCRHLAIAPNILSVRLKRLLAEGILVTRPIPERPHHVEYRLSEKGMQLYTLLVSVIAWSERWLAGPIRLPLILTHKYCG